METKENIRYWGYHLMLSATGLDKAKVKDQEYIKDFFKDLVFAIDMVAMMEPETRYCETNDEDKRGVTAFVIIETSNLCAHFLDEGAVLLDVFSCLDFDRKIPERVLKDWFKGSGTKVRITDRKFVKRKL